MSLKGLRSLSFPTTFLLEGLQGRAVPREQGRRSRAFPEGPLVLAEDAIQKESLKNHLYDCPGLAGPERKSQPPTSSQQWQGVKAPQDLGLFPLVPFLAVAFWDFPALSTKQAQSSPPHRAEEGSYGKNLREMPCMCWLFFPPQSIATECIGTHSPAV